MRPEVARASDTIDLNLLRVFEAIIRHRSVSRSSKELGVTPSAVSHALARLRRIFDDDLFLPGASGMEPTPRALEFGAELRTSLSRILDIIERRPFDAARSKCEFKIAACEYAAAVIVPPMIKAATNAAPGVSLRIYPLNRSSIVRDLDEGRLSFALGCFGELPGQLERLTIAKEREVMLVRAGHPLLCGERTTEQRLRYPHVVAHLGVTARVPDQATSYEIRHVAAHVAQFAVIPALLASSDMVATLPRRLAIEASRGGHLVMVEPEPVLESLEINFQMVWHQRAARDAGSQWLMQQIPSLNDATALAKRPPTISVPLHPVERGGNAFSQIAGAL
jgi:DNA-binding transcriptional LysR family regulator